MVHLKRKASEGLECILIERRAQVNGDVFSAAVSGHAAGHSSGCAKVLCASAAGADSAAERATDAGPVPAPDTAAERYPTAGAHSRAFAASDSAAEVR